MQIGKKIIIGIAATAIMGLFIVVGVEAVQREDIPDRSSANTIIAHIEESSYEDLSTVINVKGTVEFVDIEAIYPSNQAKIDIVHIKEGDIIEEGQVISTYDNKTLENLEEQLRDAELGLKSAELGLKSVSVLSNSELLTAESAIKQAEKGVNDVNRQISQSNTSIQQLERGLESAKDDYNKVLETVQRNKYLYDSGVISKSDYDNLQRSADSAKESVRKAEEAIKTAKSQRDSLYSALSSAESSLDLSRKQYDTIKNIENDPKVINQKETQQVNIDQAKRNIERIQKEIEEYRPEDISEIYGTILTVNYEDGQVASSSIPICTVADVSPYNLIIKASIPENQSQEIDLYQSVIVKGGALGKNEYIGFISKISPVAERKQVGANIETVVDVEITLDEINYELKAGYSVESDITTKVVKDAVVVPVMATSKDEDNNDYLFVLNEEDFSVEKRLVELGMFSGMNIEITNGLWKGERVVVDPNPSIVDGSIVKPIYSDAIVEAMEEEERLRKLREEEEERLREEQELEDSQMLDDPFYVPTENNNNEDQDDENQDQNDNDENNNEEKSGIKKWFNRNKNKENTTTDDDEDQDDTDLNNEDSLITKD